MPAPGARPARCDLAQRRLRLDGLEDGGHEVLRAATCGVDPRERLRHACGVALAARALACSDWQPPSTAARHCSVTRTTFTSGCWAVSVDPAVCAWKRRRAAASEAPKRSRTRRAQSLRAARNFATSSSRFSCALKKN